MTTASSKGPYKRRQAREGCIGKLGVLSAELFSSLRPLASAGPSVSLNAVRAWVAGLQRQSHSLHFAFGLHQACWKGQPQTSLSLSSGPQPPDPILPHSTSPCPSPRSPPPQGLGLYSWLLHPHPHYPSTTLSGKVQTES